MRINNESFSQKFFNTTAGGFFNRVVQWWTMKDESQTRKQDGIEGNDFIAIDLRESSSLRNCAIKKQEESLLLGNKQGIESKNLFSRRIEKSWVCRFRLLFDMVIVISFFVAIWFLDCIIKGLKEFDDLLDRIGYQLYGRDCWKEQKRELLRREK